MDIPKVTYKSTRGAETGLDFETVLFSTYAKDGGLYVPEVMPTFSLDDLYSWRDYSFPQICAQVCGIILQQSCFLFSALLTTCMVLFFQNRLCTCSLDWDWMNLQA